MLSYTLYILGTFLALIVVELRLALNAVEPTMDDRLIAIKGDFWFKFFFAMFWPSIVVAIIVWLLVELFSNRNEPSD